MFGVGQKSQPHVECYDGSHSEGAVLMLSQRPLRQVSILVRFR